MQYPEDLEELEKQHKNIFLYDGECGVCDGVVNFIIDRDPKKKISFASLQGKIGQQLCQNKKIPLNPETKIPDSMIFISNGKVFDKSDAALQIMYLFGSFWIILFWIGILIPRVIRNFVYDVLSKNRYRVSKYFGKKACRFPTPEYKKRFIDFNDK